MQPIAECKPDDKQALCNEFHVCVWDEHKSTCSRDADAVIRTLRWYSLKMDISALYEPSTAARVTTFGMKRGLPPPGDSTPRSPLSPGGPRSPA